MDPCCRGEGGLLDSSTRSLMRQAARLSHPHPHPCFPSNWAMPGRCHGPLERKQQLFAPLNYFRGQASTTGFVWMGALLPAPCGCLWRRLCGSP